MDDRKYYNKNRNAKNEKEFSLQTFNIPNKIDTDFEILYFTHLEIDPFCINHFQFA